MSPKWVTINQLSRLVQTRSRSCSPSSLPPVKANASAIFAQQELEIRTFNSGHFTWRLHFHVQIIFCLRPKLLAKQTARLRGVYISARVTDKTAQNQANNYPIITHEYSTGQSLNYRIVHICTVFFSHIFNCNLFYFVGKKKDEKKNCWLDRIMIDKRRLKIVPAI